MKKLPSPSKGRTSAIPALDLLRASAAFMVLLVHARGGTFVEYGALPPHQQTPIIAALFFLTRLGHEAVLLFFVLSGLLVAGPIIERVQRGSFELRAYAIDRATRILIPLVPACLFTYALNVFVFGESNGVNPVMASMVGLNEIVTGGITHNAPLWTLPYEIWFYVGGGVLGYLLCRPESRFSVWPLLALGIVVSVFSVLEARFLLYWLLGGVTFLLLDVRNKIGCFVVGVSLSWLGTAIYQLSVTSKSFANISYLPPAVAETMLCAGLCLCLPAICCTALNRRLHGSATLLRSISAFSYSLYLFHYPINAVIDLYLPRSDVIDAVSVSAFGVRVLICVVGSWFAYWFFERNTPQVRRLLSNRHPLQCLI